MLTTSTAPDARRTGGSGTPVKRGQAGRHESLVAAHLSPLSSTRGGVEHGGLNYRPFGDFRRRRYRWVTRSESRPCRTLRNPIRTAPSRTMWSGAKPYAPATCASCWWRSFSAGLACRPRSRGERQHYGYGICSDEYATDLRDTQAIDFVRSCRCRSTYRFCVATSSLTAYQPPCVSPAVFLCVLSFA